MAAEAVAADVAAAVVAASVTAEVVAAAVAAAVEAEVVVRCGEGWCESVSERVRGDPSPSLGCC